MKVYRLKGTPLDFNYSESCELEDDELKTIEELGADVVFYWYSYGSYEGSGQILFRINKKWYLHDAGHCSCYGPTDDIELTSPYDSPDDILKNCSEEYQKEIEPLIELAKSEHYK